MKFVFKTAKSSLALRDTIIIKVEDNARFSGFGEVVAFKEPFYTAETSDKAWDYLENIYLPVTLEHDFSHPFEIHQLFPHPLPMTIAGLENALCDLYFKSKDQNTIRSVFGEGLAESIDSGAVLGDMSMNQLLSEAEKLLANGIQRIKLKISPTNSAYERVSTLRSNFPNLKIAVDANQSFSLKDWQVLQKLDELDLLCIEEAFDLSDESWADFAKIKSQIQTPLCFDESVQTLDQLKRLNDLPGKSVLNVKIGRLGGLYQTKQAIDFCRENNIGFWIGSMVESGISKILHVQLAALAGNLMAGDLSDSQHYFEEDLICPEIKFEQGKMTLPTGPGLGVHIHEDAIKHYALKKRIMIK